MAVIVSSGNINLNQANGFYASYASNPASFANGAILHVMRMVRQFRNVLRKKLKSKTLHLPDVFRFSFYLK